MLKNFSIDELGVIRSLYKVDWPLHVSTFTTLDFFIRKFREYAKGLENVTFIGPVVEWNLHGTFVMKQSSRTIFFNTLEPFPHNQLKRLLLSIQLDEETTFINIRDVLRPLLLEVVRICHLETVFDQGSRSFSIPKHWHEFKDFEPAKGFHFKPLGIQHSWKINELWNGRFYNTDGIIMESLKFVQNAIEFNPCLGLYNENEELVAWNMRLNQDGLSVVPRKKGTKYFEWAEDFAQGYEAFFYGDDVNVDYIDVQSWIVVRKCSILPAQPFWGRSVSSFS